MSDRTNAESVDQAMLSLQAELDRMAAEVPEMPESFRKGWREALLREAVDEGSSSAAAREKDSPETERSSGSSGAFQPKDTADNAAARTGNRFRGNRFLWRRGLGIAAVFAFLLGGTLVGQDIVRFTREPDRNAVLSGNLRKTSAREETVPAAGMMNDTEMGIMMEAGTETAEEADLEEVSMEVAASGADRRAEEADFSEEAVSETETPEFDAVSFAARRKSEAYSAETGAAVMASEEAVSEAEAPESEAAMFAAEKKAKAYSTETGAAFLASEEAAFEAGDWAAEADFPEESGNEEEGIAGDAEENAAFPLRFIGFALMALAVLCLIVRRVLSK